jgi:uroporphyrinogen decarboxylase
VTSPTTSVEVKMTGRSRFLAAAALKPVDRPPVWFMRQAGRVLLEYRALRTRHSFLEVAHTPELCVEATLMPVERLGVDGAVVFADIMLPLEGMGVDFRIDPGVGPIIAAPVRTRGDIAAIRVVDAEGATPYLFAALSDLRSRLGERAAVIGFAAAPFTLACYLIQGRGSREFPLAKALMLGQPRLWHDLMAKLTEVTSRYLEAQIAAGADVVQLFDSWLGIVGVEEYRAHVLPYTREILARLKGKAPTIHFSTGTAHLLPDIAASGCDLVSVDWRIPIEAASAIVGDSVGLQGNLDPAVLLSGAEAVERSATGLLERIGQRPGYIFNLGHGLHPETPVENLEQLTRIVQSWRR